MALSRRQASHELWSAAAPTAPLGRMEAAVRTRLSAGVVVACDAVALSVAVGTAGAWSRSAALAAVTIAGILAATGLYRARINPRVGEDAGAVLGRVAVGVLAAVPLALSSWEAVSLLRFAATAAPAILASRAAAYALVRAARARGLVTERTLVVGAGHTASLIAEAMDAHPEYGLVPVGFVDSVDDRELDLPVLGDVEDLVDVVHRYRIQRVVVAFGVAREARMVRVLRECEDLPVAVHAVPRLFELGTPVGGPDVDDVWGIPLVRVGRPAALAGKRALDVTVSLLALVALAVPMLAIAAAVRVSSPGPVLFRQRRIGLRGREFDLLKFRTMRVNADSDTTWSVAGDTRCTPIGRALRRTGLDELPQLLNVLRGEMSLVGPRPERPLFATRFERQIDGYAERHRVPVGITGWAQVHGLRGDTSIVDRVRFDNYYIEHWSLWRDLVILARTLRSVLRGEGR